jgi:O-antigen ligase
VALVLSFSRSAWLSAAVALAIGWSVHLYWGERDVLLPTLLVAVFAVIASPFVLPLVLERFLSAESELLTSRFEQYPVAWAIWRDHFLFGYGVGNYMNALDIYNTEGALPLPVHNVLLWVAAESGLLGVGAFLGMMLSALLRAWKVLRLHHEPTCRIALAAFCAITVYLLDGLTDPLFREPVAFMMFWTCLAMTVAVVRMDREVRAGRSVAATAAASEWAT